MSSSATARLTFLYPHLFRRAARLGEQAATARGPCRKRPRLRPAAPRCPYATGPLAGAAAPYATSTGPRQAVFKRHGKAVEPQPVVVEAVSGVNLGAALESGGGGSGSGSGSGSSRPAGAEASPPPPPPPPPQQQQQQQQQPPSEPKPSSEREPAPAEERSDTTPPKETTRDESLADVIELGPPTEEPPAAQESKNGENNKTLESGPMEAILKREPPESMKRPPPHLAPPPYVHHFDSYSLVRQLESGGFTRAQAITAMKAVRALLAQNLDVAQEGLVSKSDVENETYLFKAACSELGTEVKNNRRLADEQLRQQRTLLQHEVDIATQTLNQELLTLNDTVRGMFNDRKMAVREEQKALESAIQQINYKISIMLNSEAKSEIEGLRWVLIRRSVLGIIFLAMLTLATLRYVSYRSHEAQKEAERRAREAEARRDNDGGKVDTSLPPDAAEILAAN